MEALLTIWMTWNCKVFGQNPNYSFSSSISPSNNLYSIVYNLGISHIKLCILYFECFLHFSVYWTLLYISRHYFVGFYLTPRFPTSDIVYLKKLYRLLHYIQTSTLVSKHHLFLFLFLLVPMIHVSPFKSLLKRMFKSMYHLGKS